jgi:hypothetical protein
MKDESAKVSFVDKLDWERHRRIPGGNGIALYRRTCWEKHPFDETLVTAEDLEWFLWAIATGYIAARVPQAKVLYKNQGNLRHMFRKGWLEAKAARTMLGMKKMTISGLLINVGSLGKRALFNELSPAIFFRQAAHALGAYLAVNFSTPAVEDRKQCGHKEK